MHLHLYWVALPLEIYQSVGSEMYIAAMEESHSEFSCVSSGLVIHEEYQFLAATQMV